MTIATDRLVATDRLGKEWDIIVPEEELDERDYYWIEIFMQLFPAPVFVAGVQGSGKDTLLAWAAWCAKRYIGIDTLADYNFKSPEQGGSELLYNSYQYIDDESFVESLVEMEKVAAASKFKKEKRYREELAKDAWDRLEARTGFSFHNKVICLNEVYKKMEKRGFMDPYAIQWTHMLYQYRHYYSLILMAAPSIEDCDLRIGKHIRVDIGCKWTREKTFKDKNSQAYSAEVHVGNYHIYDRDTMKFVRPRLKLWGPAWWPLFDSFEMIAPRRSTVVRLHKQMQKE